MKRRYALINLYRKVTQSVFAAAVLGLLILATAACNSLTPTLTSASAVTLSDALIVNNTKASQQRLGAGMSFAFRTLDDQADPTFNQLLGINDRGVISGYFGSGANGHPNKGYTITRPFGQQNYTNENFPGSVQTQVTAINNFGDTAGFWVDRNGNNFGFIDWNGVFTSYQDPNTGTGTVNQLLGLNDRGMAVGFYTDAEGVNHGYELNLRTGHFTAILPPGGSNVTAAAINDRGDVVGFFTASNGSILGFLLRGRTFTEFGFPHSSNTTPLGINKFGQIVGVYVDSAKMMHGFLLNNPLRNAHWLSIDDPNGVGTTTINGINDFGDLVGFYVNRAGNTDGMLVTR